MNSKNKGFLVVFKEFSNLTGSAILMDAIKHVKTSRIESIEGVN